MLHLWQQFLDMIDCLHNIGARLLGDQDQHGRLAIEPAGRHAIADTTLDRRDIAKLDDNAAARCNHNIAIILRGRKLICCGERHFLKGTRQRANGGMRIGGNQAIGDGVDAQLHRRQPRRIDLNAHRRLLRAGDARFGDAGHLRNALRNHGIGRVEHRARGQGLGSERQHEDRRARHARLAEGRRHRQIDRQIGRRGVNGRLHIARGCIKITRNIELHRNLA